MDVCFQYSYLSVVSFQSSCLAAFQSTRCWLFQAWVAIPLLVYIMFFITFLCSLRWFSRGPLVSLMYTHSQSWAYDFTDSSSLLLVFCGLFHLHWDTSDSNVYSVNVYPMTYVVWSLTNGLVLDKFNSLQPALEQTAWSPPCSRPFRETPRVCSSQRTMSICWLVNPSEVYSSHRCSSCELPVVLVSTGTGWHPFTWSHM